MGITYMQGASEVDVRKYVEWLIRQPPMIRIPDIPQKALIEAARLLMVAAPTSINPEALHALALSMGDIAVRFGCGRSADPKTCRELLGKLKPLIGPKQYKLGIKAVATAEAKTQTKTSSSHYVEYRSTNGRVMYISRSKLKKAPDDDRSYRIAVAYQGLKECGCPKPFAVLAEICNCSVQSIESRINKNKIPIREQWSATVWKERFWYSLDPMNLHKPLPKHQPFVLKWCK